MSVQPSHEQLKQFAESGPDGPVCMLNLLQFHDQAQYPAGSEHTPCSGAEAYARYGEAMLKVLGDRGAKIRALADCHRSLIGEAADEFDHMVMVEYPSRAALLEMLASDAYKAVGVHRVAAVRHSLLIPMTGLEVL